MSVWIICELHSNLAASWCKIPIMMNSHHKSLLYYIYMSILLHIKSPNIPKGYYSHRCDKPMKFRGFPKIKNDLHGVFSTSLYIALFVVDVPIMFL